MSDNTTNATPKPDTDGQSQRWCMSAWTYGARPDSVDAEAGVIRGASAVTVGEAQGHGVQMDADFIRETVRLGNEKQHGVKVRFGHPNMSSTALGTFIGRAKNFRVDGTSARADIFLSKDAAETPNGDLYGYVLKLAANDPDMFGVSIVFEPGAEYYRDANGARIDAPPDGGGDALPYIEISRLFAADLVDEPAANASGLFGAWHGDTLAGQVTEFLDTHPQVFAMLSTNPGIVEDFTARYRRYLDRKKEKPMEKELQTEAAVLAADATETTPETALPAETDADAAETEAAQLDTATDAEETETVTLEADAIPDAESDAPAVALATLQEMVSAFGADLACEVLLNGGDTSDAAALYAERMAEEVARLRAENAKLSALANADSAPVTFADGDAVPERAGSPERKTTAVERMAAKIKAETRRK